MKQTWWDKEIKTQFSEFKSWVGNTSAKSKVWLRDFIITKGYTSIVDIGCGMCDEYFEYKKLNNIDWIGIEPSKFLWNNAKEKEIPVVNKEGHNTHFFDSGVEVAYSRHVLEHQENYKPILTEMIRIASDMVIHIFFIPPRDKEIIHYNPENNLYHNTYDINEMSVWLEEHPKVRGFRFEQITDTENALILTLK